MRSILLYISYLLDRDADATHSVHRHRDAERRGEEFIEEGKEFMRKKWRKSSKKFLIIKFPIFFFFFSSFLSSHLYQRLHSVRFGVCWCIKCLSLCLWASFWYIFDTSLSWSWNENIFIFLSKTHFLILSLVLSIILMAINVSTKLNQVNVDNDCNLDNLDTNISIV